MKQSFYDKIDILRGKFDNDKPVTINDACFILWAEYYIYSDSYLPFKKYIKEKTKFYKEKLNFCIWHGIFNSWNEKFNRLRK